MFNIITVHAYGWEKESIDLTCKVCVSHEENRYHWYTIVPRVRKCSRENSSEIYCREPLGFGECDAFIKNNIFGAIQSHKNNINTIYFVQFFTYDMLHMWIV